LDDNNEEDLGGNDNGQRVLSWDLPGCAGENQEKYGS
jgi:hypothetical protein